MGGGINVSASFLETALFWPVSYCMSSLGAYFLYSLISLFPVSIPVPYKNVSYKI